MQDDDGGANRGAVYILFLNADGTVRAGQKISDVEGGLVTALVDNGRFGSSVAGPGDINDDGIPDLLVSNHLDDDGGTDRGAAFVLFLDNDGTVKAEQKISDTSGSLIAALDDSDGFGFSVGGLGDLDGDGVEDIAVGAWGDDDGGNARGAIYILFLNADGTVKAEQKISDTSGSLAADLDNFDRLGYSVTAVGDLDRDGVGDLVAGVRYDDDGGNDRGAVYVLHLNADGTVKEEQKISDLVGGLSATLDDGDGFGSDVAGIGDLDGDGTIGLLVGVATDDDGGTDRGSVYVLDLAATVTVDDVSVRGSNLEATGGLDGSAAATGVVADALTYDGANDRLVAPATDITTGAWSLSGWVNASSFGTDPRVAAKASADGSAIYELLIDDTSATTGQAMARLRLGGVTYSVFGGSVTTGSWHFLAADWDGATLSLYVDGALVDSTAAAGTIATDVTVPLTVGNLAAADRGLAGVIDEVRLGHGGVSAERVGFEYANVTTPTAVVSVGGEQVGTADPWTVDTVQVRSGTGAASAPETSVGQADAWLTAIGIDEPGTEFSSWWWFSTDSGIDLASGTRTGSVSTDQYETAVTSSSGWDLATNIGGARTVQAGPVGTPLTGQWVQVTIRTDESGASSVSIDGTEVIAATAQGTGMLSGSVGLRAGLLPIGEVWYVDDARARRLISAEPTTSIGPLERQ